MIFISQGDVKARAEFLCITLSLWDETTQERRSAHLSLLFKHLTENELPFG